jgi:putative ABC transport system permease protein
MSSTSHRVSIFLALRSLERGNRFTLGLTVLIIGLVFVMLVFQPALLAGIIQVENNQIVDYMYGNIAIEPKEHHLYIEDVSYLTEKINRIPGVVASSPRYVTAATFTYHDTTLGKTLTSVNPSDEAQVLTIPDKMITGEYLSDGDRDQIVIGELLAGHKDTSLDKLKSLGGVQVGDTIDVTFSNGVVRTYHVRGIFETQSTTVDQTGFITTKEMESVMGLSDKASIVLVKLSATGNENNFRTTMLSYGIQEPIKTSSEEGAGFVGDINTSFSLINTIMIVFSLVIGAIVIFIVIFINTVNKRKLIAIMKAIGNKK